MKQIIPFVKDIKLDTKINDVTSISLEHNLKMENNDSIVGTFTISGKYKINEISVNEEAFNKEIDFDITLDDKYNAKDIKIDIDNFYYEIVDQEVLRVHIDVLLDNLEYIKPIIEEKEEREIVDIDEPIIEEKPVIEERKEEVNITNNEMFMKEEKYVTYKIHIIRENENIETIKEMYNTTTEMLEEYNDINDISLGSKIIIPVPNE